MNWMWGAVDDVGGVCRVRRKGIEVRAWGLVALPITIPAFPVRMEMRK